MQEEYTPQRFQMLPPVVKNLLIINVIFYLGTLVLEGQLHSSIPAMLCLYPIHCGFQIWQPLTYMFMHANFEHLFFNMFALWMFGYVIENYWGSMRFLIYYILCGLGAALVNLLMPMELFIHHYGMGQAMIAPTLGASGAVYGILLAFGMMFPNERIYLYFLLPIKAKWFVLGYAAIELFDGLFLTSDGIAHFAHLGGMVTGFILILLWRKKKKNDFYRY